MITFVAINQTDTHFTVSYRIEAPEYYDGMSSRMSTGIANSLFALEGNLANYSEISEMVADWEVSIIGPTEFGWNASILPPSMLSYYPGSVGIGHIDGIYGIDFDLWETVDSETVGISYEIRIPIEQFEFDSVLGYNPDTDAKLVEPIDEIFPSGYIIGSASKDNFHYDLSTTTEEMPYLAIPELSFMPSLFSVVVLGFVVYNKMRTRRWR